MPKKLLVSIINYRTAELTLKCVASVLADLDGIDGTIAIVDNASGDGSVEIIEDWIQKQPPGTPVALIRSATNSGFSGGHNQGIASAAAEYYLILNSDAILRPGFCRAILDCAGANPEAGLIAPQIETDDGDIQVSCFRFHGPLSELMRGAASGPVSRLFKGRTVPLGPPVSSDSIEWASFACILARGEMVKDIGPMDEGYFLYFEDAEYCLRARRKGWRIIQDTAAVAVHYRGGSGPVKTLEKARRRLPEYYYASRSRFFFQAHGALGLWWANGLWHVGRTVAQFRRLFGKPVPPAIEHEARDIWTNALAPLRRRSYGDG
ncbi:MAG: glycosyltransferase family 2 protein [Pseudomonadota bacterium]